VRLWLAAMRERLRKAVAIDDAGCWVWQRALTRTGYGHINARGDQLAHRVSYRAFTGPIPDGMQLDHLCRNRACINPAHLEPVDNRENVLRGTGPTALNARKTHCIRGHELSPENVYDREGGRHCKVCQRERNARGRI
jgi:hypothetical protein